MSRIRLQPHKTAARDAIEFGPWWLWLNGERQLAEDRLKGWDYEADLRLELQPSFDEKLVTESTGIEDLSAMSMVALADCPATGRRFSSAFTLAELSESDVPSLFVDLPPGEVADQIRLSAHLILTSVARGERGSAHRPGSRLAESAYFAVRLEGDGARFPTEEVSFEALNIHDALWSLRCSFRDLREAFLGTVRLFINSDHPAVDLLLDDSLPGAEIAQSVLRFDIARQLILHVALDEQLRETAHHEYPEGSVGHALGSLSSLYLGADLSSALLLARSRLEEFERRLQAGMDLMRVG